MRRRMMKGRRQELLVPRKKEVEDTIRILVIHGKVDSAVSVPTTTIAEVGLHATREAMKEEFPDRARVEVLASQKVTKRRMRRDLLEGERNVTNVDLHVEARIEKDRIKVKKNLKRAGIASPAVIVTIVRIRTKEEEGNTEK